MITFQPPPGYRVRIISLDGDLIAWPKVMPGNPPVASGQAKVIGDGPSSGKWYTAVFAKAGPVAQLVRALP